MWEPRQKKLFITAAGHKISTTDLKQEEKTSHRGFRTVQQLCKASWQYTHLASVIIGSKSQGCLPTGLRLGKKIHRGVGTLPAETEELYQG